MRNTCTKTPILLAQEEPALTTVIETLNNLLKKLPQVEHSRNRSSSYFITKLAASTVALSL